MRRRRWRRRHGKIPVMKVMKANVGRSSEQEEEKEEEEKEDKVMIMMMEAARPM